MGHRAGGVGRCRSGMGWNVADLKCGRGLEDNEIEWLSSSSFGMLENTSWVEEVSYRGRRQTVDILVGQLGEEFGTSFK